MPLDEVADGWFEYIIEDARREGGLFSRFVYNVMVTLSSFSNAVIVA